MIDQTRVVLLVAVVAVSATVHGFPALAFAPTTTPSPQCRHSRFTPTSLSLFRRFRRRRYNESPDISRENPVEELDQSQNSRRSFFMSATASAATVATASLPSRAHSSGDKQTNLSDASLRQIILSDIVDKSFLVSADITRSVYDETATFTDEIDAYTMDKWIKGTKSLFIPSGSRVSLVGDVAVSEAEVSFRFDEDLMFNIPFRPVCSLSGKVVLTRDETTGLITSYREYWDQSVNDVLKTAKFGKKA